MFKRFLFVSFVAALLVFAPPIGAVSVLFIPFDDKVKLNEAWDLSVDIPRWYSQTVDTIGTHDSLVKCAGFDSVAAFIKRGGWKQARCTTPNVVTKLSSTFGADYVVAGVVQKFVVMKRAANSDGAISAGGALTSSISGRGGTTVSAGIQGYSADISMVLSFYDGRTGALIDNLALDSHQKDGGIKIWLPIQTENDEVNFHYLSRNPFGSSYFHKSVAGAAMRAFSQTVRDKIRALAQVPVSLAAGAGSGRIALTGKILEFAAGDAYINIGLQDLLVAGDTLEVLKQGKPIVVGPDTLGFTDRIVSMAVIRTVKSDHFSVATVVAGADSVFPGLSVRLKMNSR